MSDKSSSWSLEGRDATFLKALILFLSALCSVFGGRQLLLVLADCGEIGEVGIGEDEDRPAVTLRVFQVKVLMRLFGQGDGNDFWVRVRILVLYFWGCNSGMQIREFISKALLRD